MSYTKWTSWQDVEDLLCRLEKPDEDLERILPWFYECVKCFKQVKEEAVKQVIRRSEYAPIKRDHVIVRQGEVGDCCYIILKGTVSVFVKRTEDLEHHAHEESAGVRVAIVKTHKERAKFGTEVAVLKSGDKFGDLCFYKENKERNATVIADESLHLLVVEGNVYQAYLADKFLDMRDQLKFMETSPLFKGYPYDYRITLLEKMRAKRLHYGSTIARQGELVTSLTIICRGEALLKINPKKLSQQYKLEDGEQRSLTVMQKRRIVQKFGYLAAEELLKQKNVTVATLGPCEMFGDVEYVLGRSHYHITAVANSEMLVMDMEFTELQRLVSKRDGNITEYLQHMVLSKLSSRADRCAQVPQYRVLYNMVTDSAKESTDIRDRPDLLSKVPVPKSTKDGKSGTTFREMVRRMSESLPYSQERSGSIATALMKSANVAMEITTATKIPSSPGEPTKKPEKTEPESDATRTKKSAGKNKQESQASQENKKQFTVKEYRILKKKMQAAGKTIRPID